MLNGWARAAAFLAVNAAFVGHYWGAAAPFGLAYCLVGWALARVVGGRGRVALGAGVVLLTALFLWLRGLLPASPLSQLIGLAGLSFLFFRMTHVVVDVAGGAMEPPPLGRYLNYCLNFTTFLMGPLMRYQDFDAQWRDAAATRPRDFEATLDAANRILRGFVKAFALAPWVGRVILRPGMPFDAMPAGELWLSTYAFYLFLYLDFSGYCDIVIGIGTLMGVRPPENFRFPFVARNISDFWLRVHRSLTLWLTDYVFTPVQRAGLRSNGRVFLVTAVSLVVTMLVAGLWHGLTLSFALFGLVHGLALVAMHGYDTLAVRGMGRARFRRFSEQFAVTAAATFLTYNFTSLTYVFFAVNVRDALYVLGRLAGTLVGAVA